MMPAGEGHMENLVGRLQRQPRKHALPLMLCAEDAGATLSIEDEKMMRALMYKRYAEVCGGLCRFILDAVAQLRDSLRAAGSELIIRIGKPEEVTPPQLTCSQKLIIPTANTSSCTRQLKSPLCKAGCIQVG